ncbi:MAG: hypothetical protein HFJ54_03640 [Clostridia bacterium]|nr:hypothetical protein [Clostridia bacterium]
MKKNEKIIIGSLGVMLLVMITILVLTKIRIWKQDICIEADNPTNSNAVNNLENTPKELGRIVKVNGKLYYDTGKFSENTPRCGTMDGDITSTVAEGKIPTEDNQANFEGAKGYQYTKENTIEIPTNDGWRIFEVKEYSFCGTIKQVEQNLFFVEPDESEEIRKSADKIMVGKLKLHTNVKFEVGERVKIIYDGDVMDTYPAQINAISYESLSKYEDYNKITTLHSKTASTEILIKFNGILYGKSFSVIDYVGGSEKIGTIDKLIDSVYVPKFDGETNSKEILGASVFEQNEKTIILNYSNNYVLFEKI